MKEWSQWRLSFRSLVKEKGQDTNQPIDLKGKITFSELLSRMISKHRNKFANTVFLNHLRKHPKPGVQNLALKVQKELTKQKELFQLEGNIPSVEEVFKHYVTHTEKKEKVIVFRRSKFEKKGTYLLREEFVWWLVDCICSFSTSGFESHSFTYLAQESTSVTGIFQVGFFCTKRQNFS